MSVWLPCHYLGLAQGWVSKADCLTAPREITYDPTLAQLLSNPVAELRSLRAATALGPLLVNKPLAAGQSAAIFSSSSSSSGSNATAGGAAATAFDLELNLSLANAGGSPLAVSVGLVGPAAPSATAGCGADVRCVELNVTRAPNNPGAHLVTVVAGGGKMRTSFVLPHAAPSILAFRALVDRSIVEIFVGGGRAVYTSAVGPPPPSHSGAFVTAHAAATVSSAGAWEMGCGWVA
eukprot:SAG22_NODE_939_length_6404_cov_3.836003_3_plen_235_part_00